MKLTRVPRNQPNLGPNQAAQGRPRPLGGELPTRSNPVDTRRFTRPERAGPGVQTRPPADLANPPRPTEGPATQNPFSSDFRQQSNPPGALRPYQGAQSGLPTPMDMSVFTRPSRNSAPPGSATRPNLYHELPGSMPSTTPGSMPQQSGPSRYELSESMHIRNPDRKGGYNPGFLAPIPEGSRESSRASTPGDPSEGAPSVSPSPAPRTTPRSQAGHDLYSGSGWGSADSLPG